MKFQRLLAMCMSGVVMAGMLNVEVLAEEGEDGAISGRDAYVAADTYVLNYSDGEIEGYEEWDAKRFYFSPYRTDIWVTADEETGTKENWNWCTSSVLNMINTSLIGTVENPEGPYASIPVYCVDAVTDGVTGHNYQRVNLEDSGYFDDETAGRIRAIIMNSFPVVTDMDVISDAVNQWIVENGLGELYDEVENLNHYEVISAVQGAIWTITNDGKLEDNAYAGYHGYDSTKYTEEWYAAECLYDLEGYTEEAESSAGNINAVAHYMTSLKPMAPQNILISAASFDKTSISRVSEADATATVTVTATITASVSGDTALSLTAAVDGEIVQTMNVLDGTNEYKVVITDMDVNSEILLAIDGVQEAADVFLFDPINGREASQTMAGYDTSTLPVHAEVILGPDRVINFNKITVQEGIAYPLEGIQFDIYYVCTVDEYTAELDKYEAPSPALVEGKEPVAVVTTDVTGKASYNVTEAGQPDGIYLIVEKEHAAIEKVLDPFYVAVPMTTEDGSGLIYTINLEPKNDVIDGPEIKKDVTEIENERDSFDVGEEHTWIIRGGIPQDLAEGKEYIISDELDYRLTYAGNLAVKVEEADSKAHSAAEAAILTLGTDYLIKVGQETITVGMDTEERIDKLQVGLTAAGMSKVAEIAGEAYADYEVRVYFNAIIDEDASMGEEIPNDARLNYTNSVNFKYNVKSDEPVVYTCGINIFKHDKKNPENALAGAVFKLARVVEEGTEGAVSLVTDQGSKYVVYEEFYMTADLSGDKVNVVTTGDNGGAVLYGLEEGIYYLVEIQAPEGYNLAGYPLAVTLTQSSHVQDNVVKVANSNTFKLPETGGIGTTIFTISGVLLVAAAVITLLLKKKEIKDA